MVCAVFLLSFAAASTHARNLPFAVLVSANAEWKAVKPLFAGATMRQSPCGEFFFANIERERVLFFHGGWGKVAAAGSAQYVIDRFRPARLINLGTCAGVEGCVKLFDVVAPEKVVICDIAEAMGDSAEALAHYTTSLTLPAPAPVPVVRVTMYSADRDLTQGRGALANPPLFEANAARIMQNLVNDLPKWMAAR
jgi:adenosylhomocysteine nucleosidase